MDEAPDARGGAVIGRERELAILRGLLSPDGPPAILLTGAAGVGKTSLWEAGLALASAHGALVLSARPGDAEVHLPLAGLGDLLDGVDDATLARLPGPQCRALAVALLRADAPGGPPAPQAVTAGLLNALRLLADCGPVVVAIDDVQWLDAPSAGMIAFAARRVPADRVRFLLTLRSGASSEIERALRPRAPRSVEVAGLSTAAVAGMLAERLGLRLAPRVLRRVCEATQGNPLLALEIGRELVRQGLTQLDAELPGLDRLDNPFGERVAAVPRPVRRALLTVALSGRMHRTELVAACGAAAVGRAVADGLLAVDGDRVRPSHPLIATAVRGITSPRQRRAVQLRLANVVSDETVRAWHLAAATEAPDAALAATVAAAAAESTRRGAVADAVELAHHALRLTPPGDPGYSDRLFTLAQHLLTAGEAPSVTELLGPKIAALETARARSRGYLLLGEAAGLLEHERLLDLVIEDPATEPDLLATALATKVSLTVVVRVERIGEAEQWAERAVEAARPAGPGVLAGALSALAWARVLRGVSVSELSDRVAAGGGDAVLYDHSPQRPAAVQLACRGRVGTARTAFTELLALADERGDARFSRNIHLQLCELELRAGNARAAAALLDQWDKYTILEDLVPPRARCQALLAAITGLPDEAARAADDATQAAQSNTLRWDMLEADRARGIAALFRGDPERAACVLARVWEHTRLAGVEEPGAFPVLPDLVEALVELGRIGEAADATRQLAVLARRQQHPWGLATARRCQAAITLAVGFDDQAVAALAGAARAYGELGLRFDQARSLLLLGRLARRARQRGTARRALSSAATVFGQAGCTGWAELAQAELARLDARRTPDGELSPAQLRAARLAAAGLSNKEIARRLSISVHTVEVHLSHAYATLGIRSRTQLASRMAADRRVSAQPPD